MKEREKTMKKLSIIINGLEYVAKGSENNDLAQAESELSLIKEIAKLRNEIKELERDLGRASLVNEELAIQINDLEDQVAELEEENGNIMCKYNELEEAMNDILCVARQFV